MILKYAFILLLLGLSLYGENECKKVFTELAAPEVTGDLDDTERYLGYMGDLLDRKIIGEIELKRVLEALISGKLINPISENEALVSSAKMIHRGGLQEYLQEDGLDFDRVKEFAERNLKEEKRVRVKRKETRQETKEISQKMEFAPITPGNVKMGDDGKFEVEITKQFEMMGTPVTQRMWSEVMGDNPSKFKDGPNSITVNINGKSVKMQSDNPVEQVSWEDVQEFIKKLNERNDGYTYRLPTEAEWEYVARDKGQDQTKYHFGDDEAKLAEYAWYDKNSNSTTHSVGELKPLIVDGKEIYDLHGNVWEWVADWYGDYPKSKQKDYTGPNTGSARVVRGGGWRGSAGFCRASLRRHWTPGFRSGVLGFRLVRTK